MNRQKNLHFNNVNCILEIYNIFLYICKLYSYHVNFQILKRFFFKVKFSMKELVIFLCRPNHY